MADDIIHLFKDIEYAKVILWDTLQQWYEIFSPTRLRVLQLGMGKLKCLSTKDIDKHLLAISALFANLHNAQHLNPDEQKRLT